MRGITALALAVALTGCAVVPDPAAPGQTPAAQPATPRNAITPHGYPARAEHLAIEGVVEVGGTIGEDGRVASPYIISETPVGYGFGDAAIRQVRARIHPDVKPGTPVRQVVRFKIDDAMLPPDAATMSSVP